MKEFVQFKLLKYSKLKVYNIVKMCEGDQTSVALIVASSLARPLPSDMAPPL